MDTTVRELAALVGGEICGDADTKICGVASVAEAASGDVVLADDERFLKRALQSEASCIVTCRGAQCGADGKSFIRVENANDAFVRILEQFRGPQVLPGAGVGPGAVVESGAVVGENVAIAANCFVGAGASIGDGCALFPGVVIGPDVVLGRDCRIYPGVVVYQGCRIGDRVVLHAGVVVGADGFGYSCNGEKLTRMPHAGTVEIGDDVEVGANSTIDRAKTGATVIGSGTKIDNLVHIAHNVKIGRNCVIVAQTGVAGSVVIGDGVTLAAQSGVKDHVTIGDGVVAAARAGVIGNVAKGAVVSGFPARDHHLERRVEAARLHLPEIQKRIRALEIEVERLRSGGESDSNDGSGD